MPHVGPIVDADGHQTMSWMEQPEPVVVQVVSDAYYITVNSIGTHSLPQIRPLIKPPSARIIPEAMQGMDGGNVRSYTAFDRPEGGLTEVNGTILPVLHECYQGYRQAS